MQCLYKLFRYQFGGKSVFRSGQIFDNVERAVHFNLQTRGVDGLTSVAKKTLLRKKYKHQLLRSFRKTKSTQTTGSVFADRIEQPKKTKFELELIKNVDCFLDGHGNYNSNLVSFEKKNFVKQPFSEFQRDLYKSIGSANDIVITPIRNPSAIKSAITKKIVPSVRPT